MREKLMKMLAETTGEMDSSREKSSVPLTSTTREEGSDGGKISVTLVSTKDMKDEDPRSRKNSIPVTSTKSQDTESRKSSATLREVEKEVELDLGSLVVSDPHTEVDLNDLKSLARDNTQILVNAVWKELTAERVQDVVVVELPPPKTILPREKPLPKPKPETKWQKYAREKGIRKRKRGRKVWDETAKEYRSRYGYKRVNDEKDDWLLEVPDGADPMEDQFEKRRDEKREKISKNELQRLRNLARSQKKSGIPTYENPPKLQVTKALSVAQVSTPSRGKFSKSIPAEPKKKPIGKKRKFEPLIGDSNVEKKRQLELIEKICQKQPKLDASKAANIQMDRENRKAATEKKQTKKKKGSPGKSGKKGGWVPKKGKGTAKKVAGKKFK